jgi:hypothetical protein
MKIAIIHIVYWTFSLLWYGRYIIFARCYVLVYSLLSLPAFRAYVERVSSSFRFSKSVVPGEKWMLTGQYGEGIREEVVVCYTFILLQYIFNFSVCLRGFCYDIIF